MHWLAFVTGLILATASSAETTVLSDKCELVSVCPNPPMSGCTELTPLGESGGAVDLEVVPAGEAAFLVEVV